MTQEQRVARGSITIFILSVVLVLCLCLTATLSYFASTNTSKTTLILGGPVKINFYDSGYNDVNSTSYPKQGQIEMALEPGEKLLPGMSIDMHAIAHISSTQLNPTKALLRAVLIVEVGELPEVYNTYEYLSANTYEEQQKVISDFKIRLQDVMREALGECLTYYKEGTQDGWYLYEGDFYYCSKDKGYDENNRQFIEVMTIDTSDEGTNIPFISGKFQLPTKYLKDEFAHAKINLTLTFQAIQETLLDVNGKRLPNTLPNVKSILDSVDWDKHNQYNK